CFHDSHQPLVCILSLHVALPICKILDEANIQELGKELIDLVEKEKRSKLLLNFSAVEFLSSATLGQLISLEKKVRSHGFKLKLRDRKSTRLNSSHVKISYAVFCL